MHARLTLALVFVLAAACAGPAAKEPWRAELDALKAQQQVDHEDLRKAFAFEVEALRGELAAVKEAQTTLGDKLEALKTAAPRAPRPSGPDPAAVYAFPVGDSPVRGPSDAWVTIIEVSDFQCPFCDRVNQTLDQILETYRGDVRIVFKHNPLAFHQRAMPAAIAAMCAHEQRQFWPLHDALFANQRTLDDEAIAGYARDVQQMSFKKWRACVDAQRPKAQIEAEQVYATGLGVRGTPAFFINGRFLSGAQPFDAFKRLIDEELAKAKQSGLGRADYYEKAVVGKGKRTE